MPRRSLLATYVFLCLVNSHSSLAQSRIDPRNLGDRVIAVVPIVGAGTYADPKRPLLAPLPNEIRSKQSPIREFTWRPSDDGKFAVVEFVLNDPAATENLLKDSRIVRSFRRGKHSRAEVEREIGRYRKDFLSATPPLGGARETSIFHSCASRCIDRSGGSDALCPKLPNRSRRLDRLDSQRQSHGNRQWSVFHKRRFVDLQHNCIGGRRAPRYLQGHAVRRQLRRLSSCNAGCST
jgi:hypothetical protein